VFWLCVRDRKAKLYEEFTARRQTLIDTQLRTEYVSVNVSALHTDLETLHTHIADVQSSKALLLRECAHMRAQVGELRAEIGAINTLCKQTEELIQENENYDIDTRAVPAVTDTADEDSNNDNVNERIHSGAHSPSQSPYKLRALKVELLQHVESIYEQALTDQTKHLRKRHEVEHAIALAAEKLTLCTHSVSAMDEAIALIQDEKQQIEAMLDRISQNMDHHMQEIVYAVRVWFYVWITFGIC
jgi:chromosome segregation ATPase